MKKQIVIVDIDGTISKVGDRLKYLQQEPPDWDSFYNDCFNDEPILNIINLVLNLEEKYEIVFCTGRRESVMEETARWIVKHMNLIFDEYLLLMRKNNDKRHDIEVKPELLEEHGIAIKDIAFVLEDRNSMVKKWREMGLTCLQVANGDF